MIRAAQMKLSLSSEALTACRLHWDSDSSARLHCQVIRCSAFALDVVADARSFCKLACVGRSALTLRGSETSRMCASEALCLVQQKYCSQVILIDLIEVQI